MAIAATLALIVISAHSVAAEGQPGHHGVIEMGGDAAMCLAVLGGAVGGALGLAANRTPALTRPPRLMHAVGCWLAPTSRIAPTARAGPTELQVLRL